jgi:hypothetical protein
LLFLLPARALSRGTSLLHLLLTVFSLEPFEFDGTISISNQRRVGNNERARQLYTGQQNHLRPGTQGKKTHRAFIKTLKESNRLSPWVGSVCIDFIVLPLTAGREWEKEKSCEITSKSIVSSQIHYAVISPHLLLINFSLPSFPAVSSDAPSTLNRFAISTRLGTVGALTCSGASSSAWAQFQSVQHDGLGEVWPPSQ